MRPQPPCFLLFSGHNERALIALCRFFAARHLPFQIVAAGPQDAIFCTAWKAQVVFCRLDGRLDEALFAAAVQAAGGQAHYCPTSEFMNQFVLDHREALAATGLCIGLPDSALYARLTSKQDSHALIRSLAGIDAPPELPWDSARAPCVLKPRANVHGAAVAYPRLCRTAQELEEARSALDPALWFAQAWVEGQSYYLCAYLARSGEAAWYWQENLLQQPGGKSMVLARSCGNPGLDAEPLLAGLHRLGYHGPFMMEIIRDGAGRLHYIEVNPRFWGPLQLALHAQPRVLELFAGDAGADVAPRLATPGVHWYAWAHGARQQGCRRYPAAAEIGTSNSEAALLDAHDVYAGADTIALHGRH